MNEYYYLDANNQQCGPINPSQFASYAIGEKTLVWCAGMANWTPAGEIPELSGFIVSQRPNIPYNPSQPSYAASYNQNQPMFQPGIPPSSNLVWAILTTILCCLPLGIVSIVYASQVDSEWNRGNYENAYRKSKIARNWAIASAATGIGFTLIYLIFIWIGIAAGY